MITEHLPLTREQLFREYNRRIHDAAVDCLSLSEPAPQLLEILTNLPPTRCGKHGCFCLWTCDADESSAIKYLYFLSRSWALGPIQELLDLVPDLGQAVFDFGAGPCASTVAAALTRPLPRTFAIERVPAWQRVGSSFARGFEIEIVDRLPALPDVTSATLMAIQVLNTESDHFQQIAAFNLIFDAVPNLQTLSVVELSDVGGNGSWATYNGRRRLETVLSKADFSVKFGNSRMFGRHEGRIWLVER